MVYFSLFASKCQLASHLRLKITEPWRSCASFHFLPLSLLLQTSIVLYQQKTIFGSLVHKLLALVSNTPKLSRIVLNQRRFESARGSKTSDSPEVRLAKLDLPEVRSRINAQGGEKFWRINSNRRFVFLKVDSTQRKCNGKVCARDTIRHNKEQKECITWTFLVLKASLMRH